MKRVVIIQAKGKIFDTFEDAVKFVLLLMLKEEIDFNSEDALIIGNKIIPADFLTQI